MSVAIENDTLHAVYKCPVILEICVSNGTPEEVSIPFPISSLQSVYENTVCVLTNRNGETFKLAYLGGPSASVLAPPSKLQADEEVKWDLIIPLMRFRDLPPNWAGDPRTLQEFLPPGTYQGHVEFLSDRANPPRSQGFALEIEEPRAQDREAAERIRCAHMDFFQGVDPPLGSEDYDGRQFHGRVNVARFGELESITRDFSTSPYAEWIRFWKLYHHGPKEDVMRYAREHKNFPLSDNLMLRAADGLFDAKRYDEARQTVDELLQLFPDGDTKQPAERLKEKLRDKE